MPLFTFLVSLLLPCIHNLLEVTIENFAILDEESKTNLYRGAFEVFRKSFLLLFLSRIAKMDKNVFDLLRTKFDPHFASMICVHASSELKKQILEFSIDVFSPSQFHLHLALAIENEAAFRACLRHPKFSPKMLKMEVRDCTINDLLKLYMSELVMIIPKSFRKDLRAYRAREALKYFLSIFT